MLPPRRKKGQNFLSCPGRKKRTALIESRSSPAARQKVKTKGEKKIQGGGTVAQMPKKKGGTYLSLKNIRNARGEKVLLLKGEEMCCHQVEKTTTFLGGKEEEKIFSFGKGKKDREVGV